MRLRDRFAPGYRLSFATNLGILPYDKNDLVAVGLERGTFERDEQSVLAAMLPSSRGFIDVGANLGFYTLMAARMMAPAAPIFAFEASPIEYDKLRWTIARNGLSNVGSFCVAVSDREGDAVLYQSLSGAGALNRLDRPAKSTGQWSEVTIPRITLDSWLQAQSADAIDLMKIDVEGHELPVLRGAEQLLRRFQPVILIELNEVRSSAESSPQQVWEHLQSRDYQWLAIEPATGRLRSADAPGDAINYVARPKAPLANQSLAEAVARLLG